MTRRRRTPPSWCNRLEPRKQVSRRRKRRLDANSCASFIYRAAVSVWLPCCVLFGETMFAALVSSMSCKYPEDQHLVCFAAIGERSARFHKKKKKSWTRLRLPFNAPSLTSRGAVP